jgi:carotenoid cleavage dioxygenase-like enzyme
MSSAAVTNPYLSGNCAPVPDEVTAVDLPVTGVLPEELDGTWVRNGPNPAGDVDPATHHWFIGDGMVHGVRLRDGRAEWYRNRWVRSGAVAEVHGGEVPPGPRFGGRDFGANTNVDALGGALWAIVEAGGTPVRLTPELDTLAFDDFDGTLPGPFSAHPKRDPATGEWHAMCYSWPDLADHLQYVVVGPDARVRRVVDIPVADMPMVHDVSITETSVLVYDLPVTVDLDMVLAGRRFPFSWNPAHGARVGVLPRAGGAEDVVWCDAPLGYVFHPVNAYDGDDGRIVVDVCRYERLFRDDRCGPFGDSTPTLDRWTVDPGRGVVTAERVDDRGHEFPRVDPRVAGRPHRFGYTAGITPGAANLHGATYKTDYVTGAVIAHDHGPGRGGAEPLFVPREGSAAEDDGWLLVLVHDVGADTAELVVLDAADPTAGPTATVHLPRRVPFGFHGNWVPAAALTAVT